MKIIDVKASQNYILEIYTEDGVYGNFDVTPYLDLEAFTDLKEAENFKKVITGGYFIEWDCGADLSADTIEAYLKIL